LKEQDIHGLTGSGGFLTGLGEGANRESPFFGWKLSRHSHGDFVSVQQSRSKMIPGKSFQLPVASLRFPICSTISGMPMQMFRARRRDRVNVSRGSHDDSLHAIRATDVRLPSRVGDLRPTRRQLLHT